MSIPFLMKLDLGLKIKQPIIKAFSYHLTVMPNTLYPEQCSIITFFSSTEQNK
jgi:hypothetical protein